MSDVDRQIQEAVDEGDPSNDGTAATPSQATKGGEIPLVVVQDKTTLTEIPLPFTPASAKLVSNNPEMPVEIQIAVLYNPNTAQNCPYLTKDQITWFNQGLFTLIVKTEGGMNFHTHRFRTPSTTRSTSRRPTNSTWPTL